MKQEEEAHCQNCHWWLERKGNACTPRVLAHILQDVNPTAKPFFRESFTPMCPQHYVANQGGENENRPEYSQRCDILR